MKFTIIAHTDENTDQTAWESWLNSCPVDHVVSAINDEMVNAETQSTEPQTQSEAA